MRFLQKFELLYFPSMFNMFPTKLVFTAFIIFISFVSCQKTNEQLMKDKITDNYTSKANEALFQDYEPISFGAVDTIYSQLETDAEYIKQTDLANKISIKINEIVFKRNSHQIIEKSADRKLQLLYDRLEQVAKNREDIKRKFSKSIVGYKMKHTFNIKNKITGKSLQPTILVIYHENLLIMDIVVLKE